MSIAHAYFIPEQASLARNAANKMIFQVVDQGSRYGQKYEFPAFTKI